MPIAISGMGCICAAGKNLSNCMDTLFSRAPIPVPPGFCPQSPYPVFEVPDHFLSKKNDGLSRTVRLVLTTAEEALADAGLSPDMLQDKRVGVIMGTNVSCGVTNQTLQQQGIPENSHLSQEALFLALNPTHWIARYYHLTGPCQTVVNACCAGSDAIGLAGHWIRSGRCDVVIAGGVDALYPVTYHGFISLMNYDITPCKPFDAGRNGLNLGEGAAVLVLESETMLAHRGKHARAFLSGYGMAGDAYHFTSPDPDAGGLRMALQDALTSAGICPSDIAYINAHGTGTLDNDRIESHLFHDVFPGIPFGSTKGFTGHTIGASGAIEAAFSIECLNRQQAPASAGFSQPDPDLPAHPIAESTSINGGAVLSETLAFGGNNSVLIFIAENGA
ncbi:MAG: beta-ketoacyl-[acyl-carrier-protein] synthase family protein [Desulfatirhabdiaceae bacterium]